MTLASQFLYNDHEMIQREPPLRTLVTATHVAWVSSSVDSIHSGMIELRRDVDELRDFVRYMSEHEPVAFRRWQDLRAVTSKINDTADVDIG